MQTYQATFDRIMNAAIELSVKNKGQKILVKQVLIEANVDQANFYYAVKQTKKNAPELVERLYRMFGKEPEPNPQGSPGFALKDEIPAPRVGATIATTQPPALRTEAEILREIIDLLDTLDPQQRVRVMGSAGVLYGLARAQFEAAG